MGLTITSKIKNCNIELDGGYGMFMVLRQAIAKLYDKEFGEHYETLSKCFFKEHFDEFNKKANEILRNDRFKDEDEDIVDFLYMSDCNGKIGYKTCKKLYNLLKYYKSDVPLRYAYYSKNDWEDLKELLLQCYKHRANLYWY